MQVVSKFTYTLETIIQAGKLLVAVDHVPISTNPKTRESRLFPSTAAYVRRNALSIFRIYSQYQPLRVFWGGAAVMGLLALIVFARFLVYFAQGNGRGHIQSLIAGAVLFNAAMLLGSLGVIGDLLDAQRTLSQRTFERVRRIELQLGVAPSHYQPGALASAPTGAGPPSGHPRRARPFSPATRQRPRRPAPQPPSAGAPGHRAQRRPRHDRPKGARGMSAVRDRADSPVAEVPTGNTFDKYGSTNPVVRRLMSRFESTLGQLFTQAAPDSVLDVGCGEGVLTEQWAQALGDAPVVGLDLDDPKLRAEWQRRRRPNLSFRSTAAQRLPFADNEFDLAAAIEVLEHVPDPEATVAEMARVARRHLLVSVPHEPLWRALNLARGAYCASSGTPPAMSITGPDEGSSRCSRATAR